MDYKFYLTEMVSKHLGWPTDKKSIRKNHSIIWQNPRKKYGGSMRLTDQGYRIFVELMDIKSYNVDFPKDLVFTNQVNIWLDRFIDGPYYLTKNSIVVFKEKTAVQLVLFNGNVQKFGLAKTMSQNDDIANIK